MPFVEYRPVVHVLDGDELKKIFNDYDKNGDGRLEKEELKQAFKHLGAVIPGWRAARGLKHADANGDGFITVKEMDALIEYVKTLGYKIG